MVQIKGTAVKEAVEQIKAHVDRDAFQNILRQLDTETRKMIENEIVSSNWYSLDLFARFLEVQNRVLAGGNEEMIIRGAEAANERQLRGVYKAFVKVGSPEFVIERLAAVHATYFQGVSIEVQLQGKGKALIKYVGFQKQHRIMGFAIIGFFKKALELSGAKDVLTHFSTPIEEGKGYSELSVAWS
jgi:alkanesulfonate monooxygenase SsuD/methylene tetrahydromethanopterin reductase-like flavin-dependent oxidoreductase (luciferase family)